MPLHWQCGATEPECSPYARVAARACHLPDFARTCEDRYGVVCMQRAGRCLRTVMSVIWPGSSLATGAIPDSVRSLSLAAIARGDDPPSATFARLLAET